MENCTSGFLRNKPFRCERDLLLFDGLPITSLWLLPLGLGIARPWLAALPRLTALEGVRLAGRLAQVPGFKKLASPVPDPLRAALG